MRQIDERKTVPGKISIIMGVFNCASTLPQAIESILTQTYTNWEFIICDDCSTDDTYAVAAKYRDLYPQKIKLIRNDVNSRLAASLNHCLEYASGEYVARMDGDDISLPERFEKQVAYLQAHPECDLVGTAMRRFSDEGEADVLYAVDNPDYYTLRRKIPFHHATIMTYKRIYDALGGYTVSELTARAEDYELWFRFYLEKFQGDNLTEALYLVREDEAAIRRRTVRGRWNAFQITRRGFRLLGYPRRWLIRPAMMTLIKCLIPAKLMLLYRKWQSRGRNE